MSHRSLIRSVTARVFVLAASIALAIVPTHSRAAGIAANAKVLARLDDDWSKAAATRDADRVASFYAADAIVNPPEAPAVTGREEAQKVWASYFALPNFSISWKTTTAQIARSGELGFTSGTYEDSFDGPDGKRVQQTGKYLCTWRKQKDGIWKATCDMWNSDSK